MIVQAGGDASHGRVFALAAFVGLQGFDNVLRMLAADFGNGIGVRISGFIGFDAVTTDAHRVFLLPCSGITRGGGRLDQAEQANTQGG